MIKCIIFDMDGVLVNTEPIHFKLWKEVFRERDFELEYDTYKGCIGSTTDYLMNLIYTHHGMDFRNDPSLFARFSELKNEIIRQNAIPAVEGAPEMVQLFHSKGYRMAVASSSPQIYIDLSIRNLGIADCFELLFSAERVPKPKPAPDVFLTVAERLQVKPEECLVIEDSRNGSLAAKAAGMTCLGFPNPDSGNQDLSAADRIFYPFNRLLEVSGL